MTSVYSLVILRKNSIIYLLFGGKYESNFLAVGARVIGERNGTVPFRKSKTKDSLN